MAILKTEAIVLKGWKLRETSKILALFTRNYGKIKVVAKGARDPKSKFKGCLEPLTHIAIVFYDKRTRDLQLLSQADLINPHIHIVGDVERTSLGLAAAELIYKSEIGEEAAPRLFDLLAETLGMINFGKKFIEGYFWFFQNQYLELLGFRPVWDHCLYCNKSLGLSGGYLNPQNGGLYCDDCNTSGGGFFVSSESLEMLYFMQNGDLNVMGDLDPTQREKYEIRKIFELYFKTHLEYLKPIKSLQLFYEFEE